MAETDPTWKNWGKIKPQDGLFYQDYKKRSEILGELLARSDAEVKRLRSRVAELEGELSATRDGCESQLDDLRQEIRSVNEETTTLRKINLKLEHENAGPRAALVEEMAKIRMVEEQHDIDVDLEWAESHGGYRGELRKEARAALGNHPETPDGSANPSETPISSRED